MALDMLRRAIYLRNGTNPAFIPIDRSTGRAWTGRASSSIVSGLTRYELCVAIPESTRSYKLSDANDPNGTYCMTPNTLCALVLHSSGPTIPRFKYYNGTTTCSFVTATGNCSFLPILRWQNQRWYFSITQFNCDESGGPPPHNLAMFLGDSTEKCFPMTFTNRLTAGGYDTYANFGLPSFYGTTEKLVVLGYGGSATVTLDDCNCPT